MRTYGRSNVRLMFIAPEGSTHKNATILPFRRGAFVPGTAVMPVCLNYRRNRLAPTSSYRGAMSSFFNPAWTVTNTGVHVLRMMLQFRSRVDVTILDVYEPSDAEKADPDVYALNLSAIYSKEVRAIPDAQRERERPLTMMQAVATRVCAPRRLPFCLSEFLSACLPRSE